ncbi:MAG TPA: hypothetical protein VFW11_15380 [Cyclobacteriaceae bacterium]|nr:hypothetical protein [Cyclobacteriaceae bacterium]
MNVMSFARQYVDQIGGQFTEYDHTKAVIVVPLSGARFQTVLVITRTGNTSGKEQVVFTSKVCEFDSSIDAKALLEKNLSFDYSKFVLEEGFLKIEASCLPTTVNEEQIKEMIQEVATLADQYEFKFTGQDIH